METDNTPRAPSVHKRSLEEALKRRQRALELRREGKKLKQIGAALGVSTERARQMIVQAEMEEAGE